MEWFFDGIGTELVMTIIGLLIGGGTIGVVLYKIFINKKTINQKQKAKNHANQIQIGVVNNNGK